MRVTPLFSMPIILVFCGSVFADGGNARFYLDISNMTNNDPFLVLLGNDSVLRELRITDIQNNKIKEILSAPEAEIPGLKEVRAKMADKNKLLNTNAEKNALFRDFMKDAKELTNRHHINALKKIFNEEQLVRMDELMCQFVGPSILVSNKVNLRGMIFVDKVSLRIEIIEKTMRKSIDGLTVLVLSEMINGLEGNETGEERTKKIDRYIDYISLIEKEKDRLLEELLTADQLKSWIKLKGKEFSVDWDYKSLFLKK